MENLQPRRVIVWAYPRTLSTVFELSLASRRETKVFHELYTLCCYFGDDSKFEEKKVTVSGHTFEETKATLESDYPGKDVILSKELAVCLDGKYDRLPEGYIHTFLIRDPRRSIRSLCKAYSTVGVSTSTFPPTGGVKQLYDLHNYVTDTLQQKSIVIDSDDLANHPEKIIPKFCDLTGIPYCDSYLNWQPNNVDHFHMIVKDTELKAFSATAAESSHFKPVADKDGPVDFSDLPEHGKSAIEAAMPYYNELFKERLEP